MAVERKVEEIVKGKEVSSLIIEPGQSEEIDFAFEGVVVTVSCLRGIMREHVPSDRLIGEVLINMAPDSMPAGIVRYPHEYDPQGEIFDPNEPAYFWDNHLLIVDHPESDKRICLKLIKTEDVRQSYLEIDIEELTLDIERSTRQTTPRQRRTHQEQVIAGLKF